jgi:hypothetical protein
MQRTVAVTLALLALGGCRKDEPVAPVTPPDASSVLPNESPQDLLVAAIQEMEDLGEMSLAGRIIQKGGPPLQAIAADTLYVYGQMTSDGYGATVSERRTYPRGIPLITVRKSFGRRGRIVSDVSRYTSLETFRRNEPAQTSVTELYGMNGDTIITTVRRSGGVETFTFRLPVITVTLGVTSADTRRLSRYGRSGAIVVETRDGNNVLIQTRTNSTRDDGSLITRTDYPDLSWRMTRTLGRADGSILRETSKSQ